MEALHTLYLDINGAVWASGLNDGGQLGDGTTTERRNPVQVVDGSGDPIIGIKEISTGEFHSVFLKTDGTVLAVGKNSNGQLGDGTTANKSSPVQVTEASGNPLGNITQISAGRSYTLFLKEDETVSGTGLNNSGQLGDGTTTERRNPVSVLDSLGNAISGIIGISACSQHSTFLKSDGSAWGVGFNAYCQLGDGTTTDSTTPVRVLQSIGGGLTNVKDISAGTSHTLFLKLDGSVWAVGKNESGQLGDGTTTNRTSPVRVLDQSGNPLVGISSISAGQEHSIFLRTDGMVMGCGRNDKGQLGDNTDANRSLPVFMLHNPTGVNPEPINNIQAIETGGYHTLLVKSDGTLWATGQNAEGQLGDGTNDNRSMPVQVVDGGGNAYHGVSKISAGFKHSVFQKNDGTVWSMGWNFYGQLGNGFNGSGSDQNLPQQAKSSLGGYVSDIIDVSAGTYHTMMLRSDGTVWAIGRGSHGQHGDGVGTQRREAVQAVDPNGGMLTDIIQVEAADYHSVYLKSNGTVLASGSNGNGALGDGTSGSDRRMSPVQVILSNGNPIDGVVGISACLNSFYLKSNGTVWAAGENALSQLGDGTSSDQINPVQVVHDANSMAPFPQISIKATAAGYNYSVFLKADGTVWATGNGIQRSTWGRHNNPKKQSCSGNR